MRLAPTLVLVLGNCSAVFAQVSVHHYTNAERYAGCLVGYIMPAMYKGAS